MNNTMKIHDLSGQQPELYHFFQDRTYKAELNEKKKIQIRNKQDAIMWMQLLWIEGWKPRLCKFSDDVYVVYLLDKVNHRIAEKRKFNGKYYYPERNERGSVVIRDYRETADKLSELIDARQRYRVITHSNNDDGAKFIVYIRDEGENIK